MCWKRDSPQPPLPSYSLQMPSDGVTPDGEDVSRSRCPDIRIECTGNLTQCNNGVACCDSAGMFSECACHPGWEPTDCTVETIPDGVSHASGFMDGQIGVILFIIGAVLLLVIVVVVLVIRKRRKAQHKFSRGANKPLVQNPVSQNANNMTSTSPLHDDAERGDANGNNKGTS